MRKFDSDIPEHFRGKLYDVENALNMYAYSQYLIPAETIYDDGALAAIGEEKLAKCHIYMVGNMPRTGVERAYEEAGHVVFEMYVEDDIYDVRMPIPPHLEFAQEDGLWFLVDEDGQRYGVDDNTLMLALHQRCRGLNFEVLYIGQAYGENGSRHALDRLRKHETLQRISLTEPHKGKKLYVLLVEVEPNNRIITQFNPYAQSREEGEARISGGVDKLFNTNPHERITLYEASMIRHFQPKFNKEFKNSFPSTDLKVLSDCYEKDFAGIVSEFCFDDLPFRLKSDTVEARDYHIIQYDLHDASNRKFFFSIETG